MIAEYNTQRDHIILKEYGRNVQKIVAYIRTIPDKEKRTEMAYTLLELIKQLAPVAKEAEENPQRMWDDLFIIADFNLDVNNPYPIPERDILFKKPMKMPYPQSEVRFRHYGKNIERLIKEAMKKEDPADREEAVIYLGKLMKTFYSSWNKETLDDSVILKDIKLLSQGQLTLNIDKVREDNLFEKLYRERKQKHGGQGGGEQGERGERRDRDRGGKRHGRPFNKNRHNPHRRRDQ
ncbi:MAG: DUF4290 domain-containing protein [Bacteroidota bacterium]